MKHTEYDTTPGFRGPFLHEDAWAGAEGGWVELEPFDPDLFRGAGAVVSTTQDMNAFLEALVTGPLLRPHLVEQMATPTAASGGVYGRGLLRIPDPCGVPGQDWLYGHDGASFGTLSITLTSSDGARQVALGVTGRDLTSVTDGRWGLNTALVPMLLATCPAA